MCVMFLHYISDETIKTTKDQVTTQSNIPVSNFVLLNSVDSLALRLLLLNMKCHYYISFIKDYWASEASPTLGCSIEISRDISIYVCLSYVKLTA